MSKVFFISDLHFGHKNILRFAGQFREGETVEQHDAILIDKINSRVQKRDKLFILGDVVWKGHDLSVLAKIHGQKELIIGNHDTHSLEEYMKYFDKIHGFYKYKNYWISHCPIHPDELRGRKNIHGHVHQNYIQDSRYIPVTVEALNGYPITIDEITEKYGGAFWGESPEWEK